MKTHDTSAQSMVPRRRFRLLLLLLLLATAVGAAALYPAPLRAAWERIAAVIGLTGEPLLASFPVISEHEIDELRELPAQDQAERLLERAINGYRGATELIEAEVDGWRGQLAYDGGLPRLVTIGLNAGDLRVRAAALEITLAAYALEKSSQEAEKLMRQVEAERSGWALWNLGVLAGRGVEQESIFDFLVHYLSDPDPELRYWAIEGLAYSGDRRMISHLLGVLHDDPSRRHRERAACSLAQSGMLTAQARFDAVPALLDFTDDPALDTQTRRWVFQALKDISGESFPHRSAPWRAWWEKVAEAHSG